MNLRLSIPNSQRVLDFGCGSGWVIAGSKIQGNPVVVGIDLCVDKLKEAKTHGCMGVVAADGLSLPFASESFGVVIGHVSMPYMNTRRALQEVYRVLSPGGSMFLTFHSFRYVRKRGLRSLRERRWKDVAFMAYIALNGILNHLSFPQIELWRNGRMFETVNTRRGVLKTAESRGFTSISVEDYGRTIFAVAASKPDPVNGAASPQCKWSIYDRASGIENATSR